MDVLHIDLHDDAIEPIWSISWLNVRSQAIVPEEYMLSPCVAYLLELRERRGLQDTTVLTRGLARWWATSYKSLTDLGARLFMGANHLLEDSVDYIPK